MSGSNFCFLTCIQISQEAGKAVWYSHLFNSFPQFVVIHTIKGFSVINEAEVDIFSGTPLLSLWSNKCWQFGSSAFSKPSLYIWKFLVHILLKLSSKDFEHNLASMWNEHNCTVVWIYSLALSFFEIGMKTHLFQLCQREEQIWLDIRSVSFPVIFVFFFPVIFVLCFCFELRMMPTGTSLVVQWLRIHLVTQGIQFQLLIQEIRSHILQSN